MTTSEIIEEIVSQSKTEEVLKTLLDILIMNRNSYRQMYNECRNSLQAIHKINQLGKKDEAIDALSEVG